MNTAGDIYDTCTILKLSDVARKIVLYTIASIAMNFSLGGIRARSTKSFIKLI